MNLPIALSTAALLAGSAAAQSLDVAIVAAASTNSLDCRFVNTQADLMATGLFATVDVINANMITPTLVDLAAYDAVITWTNFDYFDSVAFGDVLADYVDMGGGVVVATFANSESSASRSIQGRWQGTYEVIEDQSGQTTGAATLGTVLVPTHPIMAGVTTFDGGSSSFRPNVTNLVTGATEIAQWSDGRTLVATGPLPNRVDLGFYPPSSACSGSFWNPTTDGDLLMANALAFSAGGGTLGTNYCMANPNSTGSTSQISAAGSPVVASNDVTLTASSLPTNAFGFFITSQTQGFVANPNGSAGNLCVLGSIGRYVGPGQIQASGMAGEFSLAIDLTLTPTPTGLVPVMAGEVWNFQAWHRDTGVLGPTSNFTDGLSISFL